jgi:acyl-CoA thioesterase
MTPQELADTVLAQLLEADAAVNALLGFSHVTVAPGRASVRLTVGPQHVNSHRVCHGGILFALGDTALAYASCSTNRSGVTLAASIAFARAAREGDVVTAEAEVESDGRRASACTVRLTNQSGELVARMQGSSLRFETPVLGDGATG